MIGSISDVLTRIGAIEQQVQSLQSGTLLDSALGVNGGSSTSSSGSASSSEFANQLASAQSGGTGGGASGASFGSLASSALGGSSGVGGSAVGRSTVDGSAVGGSASTGGFYAGGTTVGTSVLTPAAGGQLTSAQQQFASTLSADTGLNPNVVSAWLLAEESGGAAQSRQAANNNDWLNIGYTDSATYGAGDAVWSDPTAAANATAAWLKGQDSIPGYGTASSGIQSILSTVGQTPAAQIQAIQQSGWSSGGYPSLGQLYEQVAGA